MNHVDIASGVAESLQEFSENIVFWNGVIQEHGHTESILRCIMELYVVVFEFLAEIFNQWSRSSRKRYVLAWTPAKTVWPSKECPDLYASH